MLVQDKFQQKGGMAVQDKINLELLLQNISILSFVADNMHDSIYLINQEGFLTYVNAEASRMLGYNRNELLMRHISNIDPSLNSENWLNRWNDLKEKKK